jgi:hypothetical protein
MIESWSRLALAVWAYQTSSGLVVFTEDGNIQGTTTAPEPGSLMLLGVSLLALGRKFHRTS